MALENKDTFTREEVENLIKKSVKKQKAKTEAKWRRIVKITATIVGSVTILASIVGTKEVMDYIQDRKETHEYYQDYETASSLISSYVDASKETFADNERKQLATYYDTGAIADVLMRDMENFDVNFYQAYNKIKNTSSFTDTEIRKSMNQILNYVEAYYKKETGKELSSSYETFESYVQSLGFVNEKGEVDYGAYSKAFQDYIVQMQRAKESLGNETEISELGGR